MSRRNPHQRNPRLDIDPVLLRRLFVDELKGYVELQRMFRINAGNLRATLDHYGIPRRTTGPRSPKHHGFWIGGVVVDKTGYLLVHQPDHPHANHGGYVRQHRLVMEKVLGRYLEPSEVVHHKDRDKKNNDPDNLELFSKNADHLRHELTGKCPKWTKDGKRRIREGVDKIRKNIPATADLHDLYWTKGMSPKAIGQMFHCSASCIHDELKRRGIQVKTNSQAQTKMRLPSDDELRSMLHDSPTPVVAERLGVNTGSLYAHLARRGIPTSRKQGVLPSQSRPGYSPTRRLTLEHDDAVSS